jgi:hypothetical protein
MITCHSPPQSLDYHANSYHIHQNNLEFCGYDKEKSQKYPCSSQPINTSFLSTHLLPCHSPSPSLFSLVAILTKTTQEFQRRKSFPATKLSQNPQAFGSFFFSEGNGYQLRRA